MEYLRKQDLLKAPISQIGKSLAQKLVKLGIFTYQDLIFHLPLRYQDKTHITPITDLRVGEWVLVEGIIVQCDIIYRRKRISLKFFDISV